MKDWIPLLSSLVWPLFLAALLYLFRDSVRNVAIAIAEKVRSAASVEVGPSGIKVSGIQTPRAEAVSADTRRHNGLPHDLYMTHWATRAPELDREQLKYYRLKIAMDADRPELLDDVERVTYHLDPTFRDPDRTATDRPSAFAIRTAAWGEFNMTAEVYRKGNSDPLVIERYINFMASPI